MRLLPLQEAALGLAEELDGFGQALAGFGFAHEIFQAVAQEAGEIVGAGAFDGGLGADAELGRDFDADDGAFLVHAPI